LLSCRSTKDSFSGFIRKGNSIETTLGYQTDLKHRKALVDFSIQKMGEMYLTSEGKPDIPHRHDYYTVLLVTEAQGVHIIDYQSYPFADQEVHFVSPGQIHQVHTPSMPRGWVITFSREFLMQNHIPESFISNLNLFRQFGESPPLSIDPGVFRQLEQIVIEMQRNLDEGIRYRQRALGALLQLFLIYCNNGCSLDPTQLNEEDSGVCMLREFRKLVEQKYTEWHQVQQYASEIHISSKHLSHTVKQLTGKPAKEFIQDRITLEAKRLLWYTPLSIKEIAFRLGFDEPLHFSGFIRKQTGLSPTRLRDQRK
jgi:AraC family transcriptional regulator, transcriptional activator of pobA